MEEGKNADNLMAVCKDCRIRRRILYKWQEKKKELRRHKAPAFMNKLRRRGVSRHADADFTALSLCRQEKCVDSGCGYNTGLLPRIRVQSCFCCRLSR